MSKSKQDIDYVQGIKDSDSLTINLIYKNFHQAIVHLVETNQGTKADAHDVFQEGLLIVFQKTKEANFQLTSSFLTFFYAICRNIWYNKLKKRSIKEVTLAPELLSIIKEEPDSSLQYSEQYFLYRKMFLQLGKDCQKLLDLFLQKTKMADIMQRMGYSSISYTKKRKFICKEKLVKLIKEDPEYQELTSIDAY